MKYFHCSTYESLGSANALAYPCNKTSWLPYTPLQMSAESFLQYTDYMPDEFRCKKFMEVAWILLRHYAVVGTTERLPLFLRLLQRRIMSKDPHFLRNATSVHRNRSNYGKIGAQNVTLLHTLLQDKFYCGRILWKIAGIIANSDEMCK